MDEISAYEKLQDQRDVAIENLVIAYELGIGDALRAVRRLVVAAARLEGANMILDEMDEEAETAAQEDEDEKQAEGVA